MIPTRAWLAAFAVAAAIPPLFFADSYVMSIFATVVIFGIVVMGLDLVMGFGGLPSFGHNGFFALGAYVMAVLNVHYGIPLLLGASFGILLNLLLALIIGAVTLRMKSYYFTAATLGFGVIVIQVIGGLPEITGGWSGLAGMAPLSIGGISLKSDLDFYLLGTAFLFLSLIVCRNLMDSRFGRSVRAFRDDELAAEMLGIPVARQKIVLFLVSSVLASVGGSLYALFLKVPGPGNFDLPIMIEQVLMLFVGGSQSLWGAILGAGILRFLPEVLGPLQDWKTMLEGLVMMLIIIFLPRGLAGVAATAVRRLGADVTREAAPAPAVHQAPRPAPDAVEVLLDVSEVSKRFGGVQAVNKVTFQVRSGQIKAVIGPNGAGKTTLFNLLTGTTARDQGRVVFRGAELEGGRPTVSAHRGMARTFQTPRLFSSMTVLENVLVGEHIHLRTGLGGAVVRLPAGRREEAQASESAMALLELVGIAHCATQRASTLPFGQRRLLEIARALAVRPALLLVDEPAAGLNETEKAELGRLLLRLRDSGVTVLIVEHDMRLVMSIADEVLVIDHGQTIADGTPEEVQKNEAVLRAYLGEVPLHAAA